MKEKLIDVIDVVWCIFKIAGVLFIMTSMPIILLTLVLNRGIAYPFKEVVIASIIACLLVAFVFFIIIVYKKP